MKPLHYDPYSEELRRDPYPTYRRLRDEAPLHHEPERGFYVLSRFADVDAAVRDPATFSSASGLTFEDDEIKRLNIPPTIVMMDPPRHTAFRALISKGFTPRRVADQEDGIRRFVVDRVDRMVERGEADLIAELAGPLPTHVVANVLGVPEAERHRFDQWSNAIVQANAEGANVLKRAADAVMGLFSFFGQLIEQRRSEPGDDLLSALIAARLDDQQLSMPEIVGFCFVMIAGGNDTSTGMIGAAAVLLDRHRDQRALLQNDPALIPSAVEEILRLESPVQGLCRTTMRDVELHGQVVPEGSKVHMLYGAANRDHREFGDTAEQLDVTRPVERMLAFSLGPHYCLGAALARMQGRIALEEILRRMPDFTVDADTGRLAPGAFVRRYEYLPIRTR